MTKPATDEEIADMAAGSSNHGKGNDYPAICVDKLIARIRQEQESRKQFEELARSIRHWTIEECGAFVRPLPLSDDSDIEKQVYDIRQVLFERIIALHWSKNHDAQRQECQTVRQAQTPTSAT